MLDEFINLLEMQEEILQFTHFTNEDAWELGKIFVAEVQRKNLPITVTIRLNNGYTVFRYAADGTNLGNDLWSERTFNMTRHLEKSSLHAGMLLKKSDSSLTKWGLNEQDFAACGGAFPIRIEEVGVIGAVIVSGLSHFSNHDLLVKCISHYLHIDEVPRITGDIRL